MKFGDQDNHTRDRSHARKSAPQMDRGGETLRITQELWQEDKLSGRPCTTCSEFTISVAGWPQWPHVRGHKKGDPDLSMAFPDRRSGTATRPGYSRYATY